MKKILSTVAALGFVVGVAGTAAAVDVPQVSPATGTEKPAKPTAAGVQLFSVTGSYSAAGIYLSDGSGASTSSSRAILHKSPGDPETTGDAWWFHTFKMSPSLKVNDKVQVKADIRLADRHIWGFNDIASQSMASGNSNSGRDVDANKIWMEWMSPVGSLSIGRMPSGAWFHPFQNNGSRANRIIYKPNWLPEGMFALLLMQKTTEEDFASQAFGGDMNVSDQDQELYLLHVGMDTAAGKSVLGWFHNRNASVPLAGLSDVIETDTIKFYGKYNIAGFGIETEISHGMGDAVVGSAPKDVDNWSWYLDVNTNLANVNVGLMYFHLSGDNNAADSDYEGNGSSHVGNDFNPTQILFGDWMGILNADKGAIHPAVNGTGGETAGVNAVQLHAAMAVSPKMSIDGSITTAWADETNLPTNGVTLQDDDYGWEFNVGASYKLLDNLTYTVHLGFLSTGDFWTEGVATDSAEDVYLLANQLVMKF